MNVYIYNADVYCEDCGEQIKRTLLLSQDTGDSDDYPQGPTDQGESDCPEHCGSCGVFLENSMTDEGYAYLREMLSDAPVNEDQAALHATWIAFYGDPRSDIETQTINIGPGHSEIVINIIAEDGLIDHTVCVDHGNPEGGTLGRRTIIDMDLVQGSRSGLTVKTRQNTLRGYSFIIN